MSDNTSYEKNIIYSTTNLPHTITKLSIHLPFKYLQSECTPSSNTKDQFLTITKHVLRSSHIISSNTLNRYHISLYLKIHLHPRLMPPLAFSYLSTNWYNSIQHNFTSTALSSMEYNNTWSTALRYRDHKYYGLQLRNLEPESLIRKKSKTSAFTNENRYFKIDNHHVSLVSTCLNVLPIHVRKMLAQYELYK